MGLRSGWLILIVLMLAAACNRTQPQRPTWRNGQSSVEPDSSVMQLMTMNRQLADAADSELARMADSLDGYNQLPCGAWVRFLRLSNEADTVVPRADELWQIHLQVRSLRGTLLSDEQRQVRIHRHEIPEAAEEAVSEMHAGDSAYILAPWYAAYGLSGNEAVAPYSNVQMTIYLQR